VLGRLAQIKHTQKYNGGRTEYLGVFEDEREAAEAYDAACDAGRKTGDSTSLQRECSARARFGKRIHASRAAVRACPRPSRASSTRRACRATTRRRCPSKPRATTSKPLPRCRAIGRHASVNFPLEHDATGEVHAAKALLGLLA